MNQLLSLCVLGTFCLSAQILPAQTSKQAVTIGQTYELTSQYTDFAYDVSVYLPDNYEERKDTLDYPCLYLFIGGEDLFHCATGVTRLLARHREIPEMIVVGVTNIRWWPDLTPEKVEWREDAGEGKDFLAFVSNQLIPFVDKNFSTNDHSLYMGHSLGGLFGVYTLTESHNLFDDYILISPSVQDRANSLFGQLEETLANEKEMNNDVYFTMGSEGNRISKGSHKIATAFSGYEGKNLKWRLEVMPDKNHFTTMIPTMVNGLKYVTANEMEKD
ncbi:MAG: alpha/beta hydrolase-fold protein [Bacteroidota bacterium]